MKRSLARLTLLGALLAIVAIATASLQAIAMLSADAAATTVTTTLAEAPPTAAAMRVTTALGGDSPANPFEFGDLPLQVTRAVVADPVNGVILAADPTLADHARLVTGSWAGAVLQARAAEHLGLGVGDEVELEGGLSVPITGTWLPLDATEGYWFGDPAAVSGRSGEAAGPLVVSESMLATLPAHVSARWTIVPTVLRPDQLAAVQLAVSGLEEQAEGLRTDYVTVEGTLGATLATLRTELDAASRLEAVPVALVVASGTVSLARVAALLWSVRRPESALLRSRGARRRRLLATGMLEALLVAVLGALPLVWLSPWISAAVAGTAFAVLVVVAWRGIDAANPRTERTRPRGTLVVTAGATVLALLAAGLTLWQFLLYSSGSGANPFGALAPAAGLLALSLLTLLVLPVLFSGLERLAARRPGLVPVYPARHIARDAAVHATSVVLIVLVVGAAALAASYAASATAREARAFANENGADVRARLTLPPAVESYLPEELWTSIDDVDTAEAVVATAARVGGESFPFIARTEPEVGAESGTTSFELSSSASGHLDLGLWVADRLGQPLRVDVGRIDVPYTGTISAELPEGGWTLLAVEAKIGGIAGATVAHVFIGDEAPLTLTIAHPTGRVMLARPAGRELAITLSDDLATLLSAHPGDTISIELPANGASIDARVAATIPVVAGTPGSLGIATDLRALTDYLLRSTQRVAQPTEVWISSSEPALVATRVVEASPYPASVTTRSTDASLAGPTSRILWLSVLGSAVLCVIGTSAVVAALGRLRDGDRAALAALGVSARRRAGIRFSESAAVVLTAVLCGSVAGAIASVLYAPTLAASSLGFDVVPFLLVVGALTAACLAVGAISARRAA